MREIKFRAWDKKYKIMLYNETEEYGFSIFLDGSLDIFKKEKLVLGTGNWTHRTIPQNPYDFILMQYTGLKDKNGKEIYEGDIIETKASKSQYVIICEKDRVDFQARNVLDKSVFLLNWWDDTKKIGNIHENPELLEEE